MLSSSPRFLFFTCISGIFSATLAQVSRDEEHADNERKLHQLEKMSPGIAAWRRCSRSPSALRRAADHKRGAKKTDEVFLRSAVVLVQDAASGETLIAKNQGAVLPIASITKLMTAMVILDRRREPRAARRDQLRGQ
jgi:D-alanyl-D-alanine endopeptidase (penicillin-binding protein 7)